MASFDEGGVVALLRRHGFPEIVAEGLAMDLVPDEAETIDCDDLRNELDTFRARLADAIAELDGIEAVMSCCGRDESQPHTADCAEALRQDAADGDRAARAELAARGEVAG